LQLFSSVSSAEVSSQLQPFLPYLDDLLLLVIGKLQGGTDNPAALGILYVGADLSNNLRITKAVQIVILYL